MNSAHRIERRDSPDEHTGDHTAFKSKPARWAVIAAVIIAVALTVVSVYTVWSIRHDLGKPGFGDTNGPVVH